MTWLVDGADEQDSWARIEALAPAGVGALTDLHSSFWHLVDPVVLELCRLRIATLLGAEAEARLRSEWARAAGLTEEKIAALPAWPTSALFSAAERACLALTEQFMLDVNGVTSDQTDGVLEHFSTQECYAFVNALWSFEQFQRICLVLGVTPTAEQAGLTMPHATEAGRTMGAETAHTAQEDP
jgi:alkylhydroperoxidase family enzyme